MNQKIIIVPKDAVAKNLLDFDEAAQEQLIELKLSDKEFSFLWKLGLFRSINRITGSNIDDFEDESITEEQAIEKVIILVKSEFNSFKENIQLYDGLINILNEALNRKTGIFFYF